MQVLRFIHLSNIAQRNRHNRRQPIEEHGKMHIVNLKRLTHFIFHIFLPSSATASACLLVYNPGCHWQFLE